MVKATVDNGAVSIQLNDGESTTVPSGEIWDVTLTLNERDQNVGNSVNISCSVNGTHILGTNNAEPVMSCQTTVTAGDTIKVFSNGSDNQGLHIGGYVVST